MNTKRKSEAMHFLEKLTGGPLTMGELLRALRKSEAQTQEEFASLLEVSKQHLCDIEKGRKSVTPARAALFATRLGQPPAYFIQIALQEDLRNAGLKLKIKVEAA
jgi:transcriptional regulator with XRE-family HTH domain